MNIKLPIKISNGDNYLCEFKRVSNEYIRLIESLKTKSHLSSYFVQIDKAIVDAKTLRNAIINSFNEYLKGRVSTAITKINNIINKYSHICISQIGDAYAFIGNFSLTNKYLKTSYKINDLTLVKGRIGKPFQKFSWQDLFHIPFDRRDLVSSQRYSIPGIPCLYLAQNSYVVWNELGCPSADTLSISSFKMEDMNTKIIDLTIPIENIFECLEINDYDFVLYGLDDVQKKTFNGLPSLISDLIGILPLWVLISAVSFSYNGADNRSFKSEYVISQLIMYTLAKNDCIGVAYHSNRIENRSLFATNLAIPLVNSKRRDVYDSYIKGLFKITTPLNMGYYNDVLHQVYKGDIDRFNKLNLTVFSSFNKLISGWNQASYDGIVHYNFTKFYYIDEFMLASAEKALPSVRSIIFN